MIHSKRFFSLAKGEWPILRVLSVVTTTLLLTILSNAGLRAQTSSKLTSKKRPITVADGLTMRVVRDVPTQFGERSSIAHFSPDGKRFVVLLRKGNLELNTNDFSLLLYQTADVFHSPKPKLLLKMSSSSDRAAIREVRWLADNDTLFFLGEKSGEPSQLYTIKVRTRHLRRMTDHSEAITSYDITSDGRYIAFMADAPRPKTTCAEQGSCGEIVVADQLFYNILAGNYTPPEGQQVFWQALGDSPRRVVVGEKYFTARSTISISPDGRYVVFPAQIRDLPSSWASYQEWVVQQLFVTNFPKGHVSPIRQYLVFDTQYKSLVPLVNAPMLGTEPFLWAKDGRAIFFSSYLPLDVPDAAERKAREQNKYPIEVRLPAREFRRVTKEEFPAKNIQRLPLDVVLEQGLNTPPKLYVSDPASARKELLLDLNPQFGKLTFGAVQTIEWAVHGVNTIGGLYFPPDYVPGKRYPLVIQTHGYNPDAFTMDGTPDEWSSGFAARPLAAKGILVLQAMQYKNQQDYDRSHTEARFGTTIAESAKNFQAVGYEEAIDYLDSQGLIDRDRVGIIGFSRTACFVGYTLTHSKYRFAAASLVDGISCGYFEEIALPDGAFDNNNLNGGAAPFGEGLKLWIKNSPGFNLDHVQTPVRLVALGNDSVLSAWEWYAGLTLQKKPVDFILIPGAFHIGVKMSQRMLTQQGLVDWFGFWLRGEEDPDPAKRDQYTRWRALREQPAAVAVSSVVN